MSTFLRRIKTKIAISTRNKSTKILDGLHMSIFHGRSEDFSDTREYVPGDDVRDIDWRASARLDSLLIKRYVGYKKQTVMFIVDTSSVMAGLSENLDQKHSIVLTAVGTLGYLTIRGGDLAGAICGSAKHCHVIRARTGENHAENILQRLHDQMQRAIVGSDICEQLEFCSRNFRQKMIIFIISDDCSVTERLDALIRTLQAQHECFWITIRGCDPTHSAVNTVHGIDLTHGTVLHPSLLRSQKIQVAYRKRRDHDRRVFEQCMKKNTIPHLSLDDTETTIPRLIQFLKEHRVR